MSPLTYGQQQVVSIALRLEGGRCMAPAKPGARFGKKNQVCSRVGHPEKRKTEAKRGELPYNPPRRQSPACFLCCPGSLSPSPRFIHAIKTVKFPSTAREEERWPPSL